MILDLKINHPFFLLRDDLVKDKKNDDDEDEVVSKIKEVLDTKIRPAVARMGVI